MPAAAGRGAASSRRRRDGHTAGSHGVVCVRSSAERGAAGVGRALWALALAGMKWMGLSRLRQPKTFVHCKLPTLLPYLSTTSLSSTRLRCQSRLLPAVHGVADVFLSARPAAHPTRLISSVPSAWSTVIVPALPTGTRPIHHHTTILPQPQVRGDRCPTSRKHPPHRASISALSPRSAAASSRHFR